LVVERHQAWYPCLARSTAARPIEIEMASASARTLEIVVRGAVVRFEAGVDVGYVASLVRATAER
jgi:hypothetical protein